MKDRYIQRQRDLIEIIKRKKLRAFLITDIKNIRYLTGFQGSTALLLITSRENMFVTDFRYREQALQEVRGCTIVVPKRGSLLRATKRLLKGLNIRTVGFEKDAPFRLYESLKRDFTLTPLDRVVENELRTKKDIAEIGAIKRAVKIAEKAFLKVMPHIRPGVSEVSLARRLEEAIRREGARRPAFDVIVASGENAALPHARPTERRLRASDVVIIDWGAETEGYHSDMTRTFVLRGEGIEKIKEIYRVVQEANRRGREVIRAGLKASDVDQTVRKVIDASGYGEFFGHATGHGIGLDIHEPPRLSLQDRTVLQDGMVFTVEPGIYLPGRGGVRIEDMVYIKDGRARVLTHLPRRLQIL